MPDFFATVAKGISSPIAGLGGNDPVKPGSNSKGSVIQAGVAAAKARVATNAMLASALGPQGLAMPASPGPR